MKLNSGSIPVIDLDTYRDSQHKKEGYLYFEWEGGLPVIDTPHIHDFYMILLAKGGEGVHSIDFTDHKTYGCQLHFLFPGQAHCWHLSDDTVAHQLMLSKENFQMVASAFRYNPEVYQKYPLLDLAQEEYVSLVYEFKKIKQELESKDALWDAVFSRTRLIALDASRKLEAVLQNDRVYAVAPKLFEYVNLIDLHFKKHRNLSFYASKLHVTANYLNILCNRHLQKSATEVIRDRIMLEARRQLVIPGKPIKEIAFDLGFCDLGNFSKFFKMQAGLAPRSFKKSAFDLAS